MDYGQDHADIICDIIYYTRCQHYNGIMLFHWYRSMIIYTVLHPTTLFDLAPRAADSNRLKSCEYLLFTEKA